MCVCLCTYVCVLLYDLKTYTVSCTYAHNYTHMRQTDFNLHTLNITSFLQIIRKMSEEFISGVHLWLPCVFLLYPYTPLVVCKRACGDRSIDTFPT